MKQIPKLIQHALEAEKVGPEWWKHGCNSHGQSAVFLDLKINNGLSLVERLLQHPGLSVEVSTLILNEDYLEIAIADEENKKVP